ncbi:hypothetical protein Bbelb_187810 [Branchiostoma belcheri]|nr:hypothetical protein Bbelb_187810 [Branchiostoma belcheri]
MKRSNEESGVAQLSELKKLKTTKPTFKRKGNEEQYKFNLQATNYDLADNSDDEKADSYVAWVPSYLYAGAPTLASLRRKRVWEPWHTSAAKRMLGKKKIKKEVITAELLKKLVTAHKAVPIGKYCAGADVLRESAGRCAGLPSGECGTSSGRVRYVLRESAVRPAGECGTFCGSQTFCSSLLEQRKLEVNDLRPACKQDWTGSGCNIKGAGGFC